MKPSKPIIKEIITSEETNTSARIIRALFKTVAVDFGLTKNNCPSHPSFVTTEQLKEMKEKGVKLFSLCLGAKQIGFVAIRETDNRDFQFEKLSVLPEYRHQGNGKLLVEYILNYVKANKGKKVSIGIIDEHTQLKQWYSVLGFRPTGTKKFPHLPFTVGFMEREVV